MYFGSTRNVDYFANRRETADLPGLIYPIPVLTNTSFLSETLATANIVSTNIYDALLLLPVKFYENTIFWYSCNVFCNPIPVIFQSFLIYLRHYLCHWLYLLLSVSRLPVHWNSLTRYKTMGDIISVMFYYTIIIPETTITL